MIFSIFFTPIAFILSLIFGAFPAMAVPSNIASSLQSATHSLYALNSFIPVNTFATIVGIYIAVEITILIFKFFRFVMGFIPFFHG